MRTTCACCNKSLADQLFSAREVKLTTAYPTYNESRYIHIAKPNQADCRLCQQRCCAHCLTLDEVCDTCLPTLGENE